jgi:ketosteroid isomerase-like protein
MNSRETLILQNARFYDAFEQRSLDAMEDLWLRASYVRCIHPGGEIIEGRDAVLEAWRKIFEGEIAMKFTLRDVRAEVHGRIGVVVLTEDVAYRSGALSHATTVFATNVFEHDGAQWRLIHHHGSPLIMEGDQEGENFRYN